MPVFASIDGYPEQQEEEADKVIKEVSLELHGDILVVPVCKKRKEVSNNCASAKNAFARGLHEGSLEQFRATCPTQEHANALR